MTDNDGIIHKQALLIRNGQKKKFKSINVFHGKCSNKRVEFFNFQDFAAKLHEMKEANIDGIKADLKMADIIKIGTTMLQLQYFHQIQVPSDFNPSDNDIDHAVRVQAIRDSEILLDGYYAWMIPKDNSDMTVYSVSLLAFSLFMVMIKVWPLWLKIAIWWLSLIMLVSILGLLVIRFIIHIIFWILGFKDYWLLPNMLNEEIPFMDTLTPLFGVDIEVAKRSNIEQNTSWRMGLSNIALILFFTIYVCHSCGMFDGDNIPDFLASRNELHDYGFMIDSVAAVDEYQEAEGGEENVLVDDNDNDETIRKGQSSHPWLEDDDDDE